MKAMIADESKLTTPAANEAMMRDCSMHSTNVSMLRSFSVAVHIEESWSNESSSHIADGSSGHMSTQTNKRIWLTSWKKD